VGNFPPNVHHLMYGDKRSFGMVGFAYWFGQKVLLLPITFHPLVMWGLANAEARGLKRD